MVADGLARAIYPRRARRRILCHEQFDGTESEAAVWFVKNGKKTQVDSGLKRATGLAYRPDQWLLSVADGNSKWAYSYQVNPDGTLTNKEKFFSFHVPDMEDDAGAESVCYSLEGRMLDRHATSASRSRRTTARRRSSCHCPIAARWSASASAAATWIRSSPSAETRSGSAK